MAAIAASHTSTWLLQMELGLQTPQMRRTVENIITVLLGSFERLGIRKLPVEDQHPASLMVLMLDEGLKGLGYSGLTMHQHRLRLYFVEVLLDQLLMSVQSAPKEWAISSQEQENEAAMMRGDFEPNPTRLQELRERYRSWAQHAHGTTINPITGEALDIMTQCVSLQIEEADVEQKPGMDGLEEKEAHLAEHAQYDRIISTFYSCDAVLPLQQRVWVDPIHSGRRFAGGQIIDVTESEDGVTTYDVRLFREILLPGWEIALENRAAQFTNKRFENGELCFEIEDLESFEKPISGGQPDKESHLLKQMKEEFKLYRSNLAKQTIEELREIYKKLLKRNPEHPGRTNEAEKDALIERIKKEREKKHEAGLKHITMRLLIKDYQARAANDSAVVIRALGLLGGINLNVTGSLR